MEQVIKLGSGLQKIGVTPHLRRRVAVLRLCDGIRPETVEVPYGHFLDDFIHILEIVLLEVTSRSRLRAIVAEIASRLTAPDPQAHLLYHRQDAKRICKELRRGNAVRAIVADELICEITLVGRKTVLDFHHKSRLSVRSLVRLSASVEGLRGLLRALKALRVSP
ncbi:MAG: hypothetical protein QY311_01300 [Candidatus Paceibacterota bacterium]|nr:MAG: hypothetical protein QY311_01300 [Candidatus Paceibacterota bacterium]